MGISPRIGKRRTLSVTLFLIKPAIAKLCPSCSCTVVETRLTVNEGNTLPPTVVPPCVSSDTSGATFRLMSPPSSTVGVNLRPTPKSLSSSVMAGAPPPPAPVCGTGIKIFPPAKKLPSCPLMAIMLGSANILTIPSLFSASMLMTLLP